MANETNLNVRLIAAVPLWDVCPHSSRLSLSQQHARNENPLILRTRNECIRRVTNMRIRPDSIIALVTGVLMIVITSLLAPSVSAAVGDVWDAKTDWSETNNPNELGSPRYGSWSYHAVNGDLMVPAFGDCGGSPGDWSSTAGGCPNLFNDEWGEGDHGVIEFCGHGPWMVRWTSPIDGFVLVGGRIWQKAETSRRMAFYLSQNGDAAFAHGFVQQSDSGETILGWAGRLLRLVYRLVSVGDTIDLMVDGSGPNSNGWNTFAVALFKVVQVDESEVSPGSPTPDPSTWASPPAALGPWSISMTATTATDDSGVEYYFEETSGNPGGDDSSWQESPTYTDFGLTPQTQYTYRVRTRDQSPLHRTGSWSNSVSATTDQLPSAGCPDGDLDDDCDCDIGDAAILAAQWLSDPGCSGHPDDCADLNERDGVDGQDFAVLAANWQEWGAPIRLVINEMMADNETTIADEGEECEDWIEIYNPGAPIDMSGMYLEDNDGFTWVMPPGTTMNPGEYKLFWADEGWPDEGNNHTNFGLNRNGDGVTLYNTDGTGIDSKTFTGMSDDISFGRYPDATDNWYNMSEPTPGFSNTVGTAGEVYFSRPGGTFTDSFNLGLATQSPTATIYYTLNGDEPTDTVSETNFEYSEPFTIDSTRWIRARAYDSGLSLLPGLITSGTYIKLDADVTTFRSKLPIVIINSFGLNIDGANRDFHPVSAVFIDTDEVTGNAAITDPAEWAGYGGMHIRGSSTAGYPKKQYRFETWDENSPDPEPKARYQDMDVSLLGFSAESDWIIHGPYADRTLMRNLQTYTWSRQIGRYAAKSRFVELFHDKDGAGSSLEWDGGTGSTDYWGVYVFMEKVKRGPDRVDIARLDPAHNAEPEITGGYLFKKDWGSNFTTYFYDEPLQYEDPRYEELNSTQRNWIENYFDQFDTALSSGNYANPAHANYYGNYIDIDSWIDHHIIVETAKNVDGFVLSTFLSKDRGGKIVMGPVWDYNGAYGANYFCSYDPQGWLHEFNERVCVDRLSGCNSRGEGWQAFPGEDNPNGYNWYYRITEDPEFLLAYADNWFELREHHFKTANMVGDVDNNVALLTANLTCVGPDNAVDRNFTRWNILNNYIWPDLWSMCHRSNTYQDFVDWLTTWLDARLDWMDTEIDSAYGDEPPDIRINDINANRGAYISSSDRIWMFGTGGTIYYTTDGTDPRAHGGGIAGVPYIVPFTRTESTQVKARIRYASDNWSALNEATFAVGPVAENLRITEIMYNVDDPNHEFIELKNISGSATIQLN
ncbi:MAG: CotH kinase family protein, partial [Planctomycetota bacterium]